MSFRRVAGLAMAAFSILLWVSCGQVYRPVVIPQPSTPPNPANFHQVFAISTNVASSPGTALQIDVSGDSNIGVGNMGINPTHAAILPNNSRVFVASAGSLTFGESDVITAFTPAIASISGGGLGNTLTYSLPNVGPNQSSAITSISESGNLVTVVLASPIGQATVGGPIVISGVIPGGYDGNFTITSVGGTTIQYNNPVSGLASASSGTATVPIPTFCSYQPDFVATAQTNAVFVANYGQENGTNCSFTSTDSVAALNTTSNTVSHIQYLGAGTHPIALLETPNAQNLYVVNQGNGTSATNVLNLSPVDLSTIATIPIGVNPSWIAMRANGQRVYVVTQGDGKLYSIDTATNTVVSTVSVGAGANFVLYDKNLDRLYVTNPTAGVVYVLSETTDPPSLMGGSPISIPPAPPCAGAGSGCGSVTPVSVAALPDGSRFYVASYQTQSPCSDPNVTSATCLIPTATIFDAKTLTVKNASSSLFAPALALLTNPPFAGPTTANLNNPFQYAVPELSSCVPPTVYTPGTTRFRMFASSATDGSHVYVSICDAGAVADIVTNTNTLTQGTNAADKLVIDLLAPFSAAAPTGVAQQPPPQSPLFLLTGQ